LPAVLALELEAHERLVVDGAWLLPSFVAELELPDTADVVAHDAGRPAPGAEAAHPPATGATTLMCSLKFIRAAQARLGCAAAASASATPWRL
jgi:nucleoside-diphosphate-sugar epimerase